MSININNYKKLIEDNTIDIDNLVSIKQNKIFVTVGPNGDYLTDGTSDNVQVQQAIDYVGTQGGGTVFIQAGDYFFSSGVNFNNKSNIILTGEGKGVTVLKGQGAWTGDYFIKAYQKLSPANNIVIKNLSTDSENIPMRSGIRFDYVNNLVFDNISCYNCSSDVDGGAENTWGIHIGTNGTDATSPDIFNDNLYFNNCDFDAFFSTFEQVLLLNTSRASFNNCNFLNNTRPQGPGIGLYQRCEDINITNCNFDNLKGGAVYYGLSSNRINITNSNFQNCAKGVEGANLSDNGSLGYGRVSGLTVINCNFTKNTTALQLGATDGAIVSFCKFEENEQIGIRISGGNAGTNNSNINYRIVYNTFRRNNTSNTETIVRPPILFSTIGGEQNGLIEGNTFWDNAPSGVYYQPLGMVFYGAQNWSKINILNNRIESVGSYANTPIVLTEGATLTAVNVDNNYNINPNNDYNLTVSTNTNISRKNGKRQYITVTADVTLTLLQSASPVDGDELELILRQGPIGSRHITLQSNYNTVNTLINIDSFVYPDPNAETKILLTWKNNKWNIKQVLPKNENYFFNDFVFNRAGYETISTGGSGALNGLTSTQAPYKSYNGAMYFSTGTDATGRSGARGELVDIIGKNKIIFESKFRISDLITPTDSYIIRLAAINSISSSPTEGFYVEYNGTSNNFLLTTKSNPGTTTTNSGVAVVANTDYIVKLVVNKAGTEVKMYINGVLTNTNTTNIPIPEQGNSLGFGASIIKSSGTNARWLIVDYFAFTAI